jgi:hypothetical protein
MDDVRARMPALLLDGSECDAGAFRVPAGACWSSKAQAWARQSALPLLPQSSSAGLAPGRPLPVARGQARDQLSGRLKYPQTEIPTGIAGTNTTPFLNERVTQHAFAGSDGRVAVSVDAMGFRHCGCADAVARRVFRAECFDPEYRVTPLAGYRLVFDGSTRPSGSYVLRPLARPGSRRTASE